jgi:hypothetical protein
MWHRAKIAVQYSLMSGKLQPEIRRLEQHERPPMATVPEYREKFAPGHPD